MTLTQNRLLDALPEASRKRLLAFAETVTLSKDCVLYDSHARPRYGHFFISGLAKIILPPEDGEGIECGLIGHEGVPEGLHLLGPGPIVTRCIVQAPAVAVRISFEQLDQAFQEDVSLRSRVLFQNQVQAQLSAQIASCNALHDVQQRMSRLLLMVADRLRDPLLPITQECLARMIGARRSTVTVEAGALHRRGLITYTRGTLKITDRIGLEKAACECYSVSHQLLIGLFQDR